MRWALLILPAVLGCANGELLTSVEVKIEMPIRCYRQGLKTEIVLEGTVSSTGTLDNPLLAQITEQAGYYVRQDDGRTCTIGYALE